MTAPRLGGASHPTATTRIQGTAISLCDYCKSLHIDPPPPVVSTSSPFSTLQLARSFSAVRLNVFLPCCNIHFFHFL